MKIDYAGIVTRPKSPDVERQGREVVEWFRARNIRAELHRLAPDLSQVSVLGGVRVGRGSVVAAGAVVSRSLPADGIAMGVPAAVVRSRR